MCYIGEEEFLETCTVKITVTDKEYDQSSETHMKTMSNRCATSVRNNFLRLVRFLATVTDSRRRRRTNERMNERFLTFGQCVEQFVDTCNIYKATCRDLSTWYTMIYWESTNCNNNLWDCDTMVERWFIVLAQNCDAISKELWNWLTTVTLDDNNCNNNLS